MGKPMTVFVYKEYYDTEAYGTELLEVYEKLEYAKYRLQNRVIEFFGMPFEDVKEQYDNSIFEDDYSDDKVTEEYVSISDGGGTHFWIIEEREVFIG